MTEELSEKIGSNINIHLVGFGKSGVDIGEKEITKPAKVEIVDKECILLTICEGKFHQVKRMLVAVDNEVTYLKRISFGSLVLDETLPKGAYRALTEEEIEALRGCIK